MRRRLIISITSLTLAAASVFATAAPASASDGPDRRGGTQQLAPRTQFVMKDDGSSGLTAGGEGIPNIDIDKKTINTYYGDPGTGFANMTTSPYISEMAGIVGRETAKLQATYDRAVARGQKPAIVLDTDDTTLMTYDMEVAGMHFNFDPALQNVYVQEQRFPATPSMVAYANRAAAIGFTVFGLTGRNDTQKAATLANLSKVGYTSFTSDHFFTKWVSGATPPAYVTCVATCTTVEYKALTRKYIEQALGYTITLNVGDQWSDLLGGYAARSLKLPNPTYYLPSPNLPGVSEPELTPRTRFTMKADGSSGLTEGGEGIPNIDSVKKTIYAYYGDPGTGAGAGIANKTDSPYIRELRGLVQREIPRVAAACLIDRVLGKKPAIVLDADDTTLWTYDMEVAGMHFNFDPALQDIWVKDERFPATPSMVSLSSVAQRFGCTLVGLTGRRDDQKDATLENLKKVGYTGFTAANYYTKWTGVGDSQQPAYVTCATASCTRVEFKAQTRKHVESPSGGGYDIVANYGDQFSDLLGGYADRAVKLPNPTYYLP